MAGNDKIEFRAETEKKAAQVVDQLRVGGINISELARKGFRDNLRETLTDEEKIALHQRYKNGDLSEEVAKVLIGDGIEDIEREREAFEAAKEIDTDGFFRD